MRIATFLMLFLASAAHASPRGPALTDSVPPRGNVERVSDGLIVHVGDGLLKLEVCAADVVRVAYAKDKSFFTRKSLAAAPKRCDGAKWDVTQDRTPARRRSPPRSFARASTSARAGCRSSTRPARRSSRRRRAAAPSCRRS